MFARSSPPAQIPLDRLLLETDAPWCGIQRSHASHAYVRTPVRSKKKNTFERGLQVKSRNEPCNLVQVLEVVAQCHPGVQTVEQLAAIVHANTLRLFWGGSGAADP